MPPVRSNTRTGPRRRQISPKIAADAQQHCRICDTPLCARRRICAIPYFAFCTSHFALLVRSTSEDCPARVGKAGVRWDRVANEAQVRFERRRRSRNAHPSRGWPGGSTLKSRASFSEPSCTAHYRSSRSTCQALDVAIRIERLQIDDSRSRNYADSHRSANSVPLQTSSAKFRNRQSSICNRQHQLLSSS